MNNNLKVSSDFKKNDSLNNLDLNNNLIYGSIITVNLIDIILEHYKGRLTNINSNTGDTDMENFFNISLKNFFTNKYKNEYGNEHSVNGFIKLLSRESNNNYLKFTDDSGYNLPLFDFTNKNGNINMYYEEDGNYWVKIQHKDNLQGSVDNYSISNATSYGYDTTLYLNSYKIDKFGHVKENNSRKVQFPDFNKTIFSIDTNIVFNGRNENNKIRIYLNDTNKYYTIFIFTFYLNYRSKYHTEYFSSKELYQGAYRFIQLQDGTVSDNTHFGINVFIKTDGEYIYLWKGYSSLDVQENFYLKRITAYTIN